MTMASSVPVWFGAHVLHATENQDVVEGDDPSDREPSGSGRTTCSYDSSAVPKIFSNL